jgi:hypothetical protein
MLRRNAEQQRIGRAQSVEQFDSILQKAKA